jgi:hypothetical protein
MIHSSTLATRPLVPPLSRATADIPIQARVEIARHKPRGDGPLPMVSLMADRLLHHTRGLADCATSGDLRADGFSAEEVETFGEAARELAAAREAHRLARHSDNFGA